MVMVGLSPPLAGLKRSGGVVPAATNWGPISGADSASNTALQITGIGETIMLRAEISSTSLGGSASGALGAAVNGLSGGSVGIADGNTLDFSVEPDDFVGFDGVGFGDSPWTVNCTVTIKYKSAGSSIFDQTLDTFTVSLGA